MTKFQVLLTLLLVVANAAGFTISRGFASSPTTALGRMQPLYMSEEPTSSEVTEPTEDDLEEYDDATREQMEKARRAQELREQEVFMTKSTGKHKCTNCDWEFDEEKGDSMMIGGMIKPGTKFEDLPADWRCPVCRASKDAFEEVVEEIPGFEVNQGYGFGSNSWTAGQKNLAVFGGLGAFFLLFLSGYALS